MSGHVVNIFDRESSNMRTVQSPVGQPTFSRLILLQSENFSSQILQLLRQSSCPFETANELNVAPELVISHFLNEAHDHE